MRDHYEVLQVDPRADPDVIRAAYRVLARKYHPDHGGDPLLMIALNDAWDVLGSPERRAVYDAARARPSARPPATSVATAAARSDASGASAASGPASAAPASPPSGWRARATAPRPPGPTWSETDNGTPHAGPPPGNPSGSVINFGQYADWSLGEIGRFDVNYLEWLERSPSGRKLRPEIEQILRQRRPAQAPPARGRFGR
jgi:curved DNA-binding protein CbpA